MDKFIKISDSFLIFWKIYIKFYYCNGITGKDIASYFIVDIIFSSFLAEIGLKSLIAYEKQIMYQGHYLNKLFLELQPITQKTIADSMGYKLDELLIKLEENNNHFIHWRYYYELKEKEVDIKFMENLLNSIYAYIVGLRIKLNLLPSQDREVKLTYTDGTA